MHKPCPSPPRVALAAAICVLLSCGESTGPGAETERVLTPGVIVSGRVEGVDRPAEYALPVKAGDEFVVYFQSFRSGLMLSVIHPWTGRVLAQAADWDTAGTLTDIRTPIIRADADVDLLVRVTALPEVDFGDFRLLVASAPQQPEAHAAHVEGGRRG
jgi:hypothetical protein